ncbi:MAG: hypothetical protein RIM99_00470 [Cyclobacteriaceae bacterium]
MKKAKQFYLSIIVICLIIISVSIYYSLGGFEKMQVFEFDGTGRTVIGRHYIGRYTSDKVKDFYLETKALIDSGKLKGRVALVEYKNDTIGQDSVHLFIGASFDEIRSILEIPSGYTYEEYKTSKIYRVFITQHPLVRPTPDKVRSLLEVKSIEDGKVLQPYSFDIYYPDGSWCTEAWVK